MLSKYVWVIIAQENYLPSVDRENTVMLSKKNRLFEISLVACFLTWNNITERSWLFLFNVGLKVHLRLAGQKWTGADIDWNNTNRCDKIDMLLLLLLLLSPET